MKFLGLFAAFILLLLGGFFVWESGRASARSAPPGAIDGRPPVGSASIPVPDTAAEPRAPTPVARTVAAVDSTANDSRPRPRAAPGSPGSAGERKVLGAILGNDGFVTGAQVSIFADGSRIAEADTGPDGRFEISFSVPQRELVLRVDARGFAPLERRLGEQHRAGQQFLGNLRIEPGVLLEGVVLDESRRVIQGAEVRLGLDYSGERTTAGELAITDAEGHFRFSNAPPRRVFLFAASEGFGERTVEHVHRVGEMVEIELVRPKALSLRLSDADGEPIAGASVSIRSSDPSAPAREGESGDDGRVRFDGLSALQWTIRASAPGFRPGGLSPALADGNTTEMTLERWAALVGVLRAPARSELPEGARVFALPSGARGDTPGLGAGGTEVGTDGRFRIGDLRPGTYVVHATAPGFARTSSDPVPVRNADVNIGSLVLNEGGELRLRIRVGDGAGAGVRARLHRTRPTAAQVWSQQDANAEQTTLSDAEGGIRLENLVAGECWLSFVGDAIVPESAGPFRVRAGRSTEPRTIELQRGFPLAGRVLDANGSPVARARVVLSGPVSHPVVFSDEGGRYVTPPLPPGSYLVHAMSTRQPGRDTKPTSVDVGEGESGRVDLTYE